MEIFPGIHQIRSEIADRDLFQYLFVGDNVVLLDTGHASTPTDVIFPYLATAGVGLNDVSLAINTHADADHHGGNQLIKSECANVLLACGERDRNVIEDPEALFASRYNQWMVEHSVGLATNPEGEKWVRQMTGNAQQIDLGLHGGENIRLGSKDGLQVLHVPGHSRGHLAVYNPRNNAVFVGDALQGATCPSRCGAPSLPPAYLSVLGYLSTIKTIERLNVDWIYSAHWPCFAGPKVSEFLVECRSFVDRADMLIRGALEWRNEGLSLRECMEICGPLLGKWPADNRWLLMYPILGHLQLLENLGVVTTEIDFGITRWKMV
jgi:glyoxylase-like metal-dependent hydrolase (beta-lactamase superfamily II)